MQTSTEHITILGVGNILLTDEGIGVRVIEQLANRYDFDPNVELVDGGVLGIRLMGVISQSDILIVVDAVHNNDEPGSLYRLADEQVPRRMLAKQSMHQMDLPEVLALCAAVDKVPQHIVVIGVEPLDTATLSVDLSPVVAARMDALITMVLDELDRMGAGYCLKNTTYPQN
ncbi:MAG: hypothetical protein VR64_24575 [Desulfatitalea sp. BRH_c12]|nr:MAG: hypothetical protein VR64_24575 [Desulfatitalea sp. BRH_c12]